MGYYAMKSDNYLPTYRTTDRSNLQWSISWFL